MVRWMPIAKEHLAAAHQFLSEQSPQAADEIIDLILSTVEALSRHPRLGRQRRVEGTRELVVAGTPFIVAYRIRRDQVHVLAVLHGAQRWPDHF